MYEGRPFLPLANKPKAEYSSRVQQQSTAAEYSSRVQQQSTAAEYSSRVQQQSTAAEYSSISSIYVKAQELIHVQCHVTSGHTLEPSKEVTVSPWLGHQRFLLNVDLFNRHSGSTKTWKVNGSRNS
jgi:hypothetical protein